MAVHAEPVKDRAASANRGLGDPPLIDLRAGSSANGGSLVYEGDRLATGFHWHDVHQIEYAVHGVVEVDTIDGSYLLPPHQAAWIPAGCAHQATLHASVRTISVLFDPTLVTDPGDRVRIIAASPLIRELVTYSVRWPIRGAKADPVADDFFRTLGHLVGEALDNEAPLSLPNSDDPVVAAATAYTREHLSSITIGELCDAVGVSERTLRRRFDEHLHMTWRSYLLRARLLRAMAMLAEPNRSVIDVAIDVGFESASAFARSFGRHAGESPSSYRRRVAVS